MEKISTPTKNYSMPKFFFYSKELFIQSFLLDFLSSDLFVNKS